MIKRGTNMRVNSPSPGQRRPFRVLSRPSDDPRGGGGGVPTSRRFGQRTRVRGRLESAGAVTAAAAGCGEASLGGSAATTLL